MGYGADFQRRLDLNSPLQPSLVTYINSPAAKILDVGAGPMTSLGKTFKGQLLDITAADALAKRYDELLEKYQIAPSVRIRFAERERLTDVFPPDTFDMAHAQNCLDHAYSPLAAIEQMVLVTKPGGTVYLRHMTDEAATREYGGLHRWNFHQQGKSLALAAPGRRSVNVNERLGSRASCVVTTEAVKGRDFVILAATKL